MRNVEPVRLNRVNGDQLRELDLDLTEIFAPWAEHDALGIAASGGADSLALLLLADIFARENTRQLLVLSVDHAIRAEARDEVAFVQEVSKSLDWPCEILRWHRTDDGPVSHARARDVRYRLMAEAVHAKNVQVVLTAHHAQDQAETLLMRLANQSGLGGLAGIRKQNTINGIEVGRPLLGIDPEILKKIVALSGLRPVEDPSNDDPKYERTRWRKIYPQLEQMGLDMRAWTRFAARARRADMALDWTIKSLAHENVSFDRFGIVSLARDKLTAWPEEISLRVLQSMVAFAGGSNGEVELAKCEEVNADARAGRLQKQTLGGAVIDFSADTIIAYREVGRLGMERQILGANSRLQWDFRFEIQSLLNEELVVEPGVDLTREQVENHLDEAVDADMMAVRACAVVRDGSGKILAIGAHGSKDMLNIELWPLFEGEN